MKRGLGTGMILLVLLSGCGLDSESVRIGALPLCDHPNTGRLLLMAQSVPSAQLIPCIKGLPDGWILEHADVESGRSQLQFDHPVRDDLFVVLLASCFPEGEFVGTASGVDSYVSTRGTSRIDYHVFEGGCIRLESPVGGGAEEMAQSIDWLERAWLREQSGWEL